MRFGSYVAAVLVVFSGISSALAADRTMNLSVNPLGLALGAANLSADFGIGESISVGPSISYTNISSTSVSGTKTSASGLGFGANLNWFLGRKVFTDSWFLNPFFGYTKLSTDVTSASGTSIGANIGYWWFWENGINLGLGLGIQTLSIDLASLGLGSVSGTLPSAMFQFGYAF